jgi:hypothetical protein
MITTDTFAFYSLLDGLRSIVDNSHELNGLFNRIADRNRKPCQGDDDSD